MTPPDLTCPACGKVVLDIDVQCKDCGFALSSTGAQRLIGEVVLGQYTITGILGQGGMSVVYRGKHSVTGQEVALKVLPPDLAAYRDVKDRFLEEGRALAQLDHPNIVHLYNFGSDGDSLILAMQFVRGKTWERMIMEDARLPWKRTAELTCDVSRALDYAHGRGIIHRDMKPSNVLIRELDGAGTVMDFGIAKVQSSSKLTATGQTMGTVRYMSPEQVRGKPVDERTDIYSLAITAYESVVGDTPFTGDTHFEIMTKHLSEVPVPPSQRGIEVSPAFEAVLMRAISKEPEQRQSCAREFTEQIEAALEGTEQAKRQGISLDLTMPSPTANMSKAKRPVWLFVALALAVLSAGTVFFFVAYEEGESEVSVATTERAGSDSSVHPTRSIKKDPLESAFLLPGLQLDVDERFREEGLRVVSTKPLSVESIRKMVGVSRDRYRDLSREQGWVEAEISQPLTLVLVPHSVLCNSALYEKEGYQTTGCQQQAWYRPIEYSLYLVPPEGDKALQQALDYWVAVATCIHGSADCMGTIQKKLGI